MPAPDEIVPQRWGEYGECLDLFRERTWDSLGFEDMLERRACVFFVSRKALLYFLPAFLLGSLEEISRYEDRWDVTSYALDAISRVVEQTNEKHVLSTQQRSAVEEYVQFLLRAELTPEARQDVLDCETLIREKGS